MLDGSNCWRSKPIPEMAGDEVGLRTGLQFALTTSSMTKAFLPRFADEFPRMGGVAHESESSSPDVTGVRLLKPRTV